LLDKQCKLCRPHVGLYEPANAGPHPAQGPPAHSKRPRSGLSEYTTFLQPATGISHTTSVCHQPGVREEFTGAGNGLSPLVEEGSSPWRLPRSIGGRS
jgi:hypothetical protein